jgi:hypothetical protein
LYSIELAVPDTALNFFFVEDYGLNELANHEGKPALRKLECEVMVAVGEPRA